MLFIELAIGLAVAVVFFAVFIIALQVFFWLLFAFLVVAAVCILIFNFPIQFFAVIAIIVLAAMGLFHILLSIGRAVRRKLYNPPPPPPPSTPELPS